MSHRVLLPQDVIPEAYDLSLEPDLEKCTFEGVVKIRCNVEVATNVIVLHAKQLAIQDVVFQPENGESPMHCTDINMSTKAMTLTFIFEDILPTGCGTLQVTFSGILNDQMAGFYRSRYTRFDGVPLCIRLKP